MLALLATCRCIGPARLPVSCCLASPALLRRRPPQRCRLPPSTAAALCAGALLVNFDKEVLQLMRETRYIQRLGLPIPDSAHLVLLQEEKFTLYHNQLTHALAVRAWGLQGSGGAGLWCRWHGAALQSGSPPERLWPRPPQAGVACSIGQLARAAARQSGKQGPVAAQCHPGALSAVDVCLHASAPSVCVLPRCVPQGLERLSSSVPDVLQPLLRPHLEDLQDKMQPGLLVLTWTSMNIDGYLHRFQQARRRAVAGDVGREGRRQQRLLPPLALTLPACS